MVFWGRGLAYTRESERDMKPVAAADHKRKEPKVAHLACLTLAKKKIWKREKEEIDFFIFCLKIRPFEAIFFVMDLLQPRKKTLLEVHNKKDICL